MLARDWSAEHILDICKRLGYPVSHEWIYNHVLADFYGGGGLFSHLRHRLRSFYLVKKVTSKHADAVTEVTVEIPHSFKSEVHSITANDGLGFTDHERIANELKFIYQYHLNLSPRKSLGFIQPDMIFKW